MWTQLPPEKRAHPPYPILVHVCCGQMAGWMKTPLGTEVDLSPGHIVLYGVPAPAKGAQARTAAPLFSARVYCGHGRPSQLLLSSCLHRLQQSVPILYSGTPPAPLKIAPSHWGSGPPSNTWFPGPTRVLNPNGISKGSVVFAGLTSVTDRDSLVIGIHGVALQWFHSYLQADRSMSSMVVPHQPWFTLSVLCHKDRFLVLIYSFCIRQT